MQPPPPVAERPAADDSPNPAPLGTGRERALLAAQTLLLVVMAGSVATRLWADYPWFGWLLVALTVAAFLPEMHRRRDRRWWFVYVAGIYVYTILRSYADETWIPIRTDYVIVLDGLLPGSSPVPWIQDLRLELNLSNWFDYLAIATHWSFFFAPHLGAVLAFRYRRRAFPRYAGLLVVTMWLGLALFYLLPTVPPWLAAEQGELDGVTRVMDTTIRDLLAGDDEANIPRGESTYDEFYDALGEPNSVAAMPSIHMAVTVAMYLWARKYARRWAWPLFAYSVLMAGALVYLGEHYVADEVAGVAVALLAWLFIRRLIPPPLAR